MTNHTGRTQGQSSRPSLLTPIPTRYAGCHFRSRLEARWAVFFNTLGIKWEYEPQGYLIGSRPYLPDFSLTLPGWPTPAPGVAQTRRVTFGDEEIVFAEIKNSEVDEHEGEHIKLCRTLAHESGRAVLLLVGIPAYRLYNQFLPGLAPSDFTAAFFQDYGRKLITAADEYWFERTVLNGQTGVLEWAHNERQLRKSFGQGLVDAVEAARSARFEHGQSGAR